MRYVTTLAAPFAAPFAALADPLPSWRPTATEAAIIGFVGRVTDPGAAEFVPEPDLIAVFDSDGTPWSEQPMYFRGLFAVDKPSEKARSERSILDPDAVRAADAGDAEAVMASGQEGLVEIIDVSHAAGDSDGAFRPPEHVTAGAGPSFAMIVHQTDVARAFAHDVDSASGRVSEALDAAPDRGWVVLDMAADWSRVWTGAE